MSIGSLLPADWRFCCVGGPSAMNDRWSTLQLNDLGFMEEGPAPAAPLAAAPLQPAAPLAAASLQPAAPLAAASPLTAGPDDATVAVVGAAEVAMVRMAARSMTEGARGAVLPVPPAFAMMVGSVAVASVAWGWAVRMAGAVVSRRRGFSFPAGCSFGELMARVAGHVGTSVAVLEKNQAGCDRVNLRWVADGATTVQTFDGRGLGRGSRARARAGAGVGVGAGAGVGAS